MLFFFAREEEEKKKQKRIYLYLVVFCTDYCFCRATVRADKKMKNKSQGPRTGLGGLVLIALVTEPS